MTKEILMWIGSGTIGFLLALSLVGLWRGVGHTRNRGVKT